MNTPIHPRVESRGMLWAGQLKTSQAVQGTVQLGYPEGTIVPIGLVLLISLVCYLIPRTSILGAILLTGYLGGATATMVRVGNPWIPFPVFIGMLVWAGIYFRDAQVRALIPLRKRGRFLKDWAS